MCGLARLTYLCLIGDTYTDCYTALAAKELLATHSTVLCSVPLSSVFYQKTGNFAAPRFHPYLCRCRTGMVIAMKKVLLAIVLILAIVLLTACSGAKVSENEAKRRVLNAKVRYFDGSAEMIELQSYSFLKGIGSFVALYTISGDKIIIGANNVIIIEEDADREQLQAD